MVLIIVGMLAVSLALSYAWWCKVRVIRLRQDLFDMRDALFDAALEIGCLDDPAYRAVRRHFNAIAGTAGFITIPVFVFLLHRGVVKNQLLNSENSQMQKVIDSALESCANRVIVYLLKETFTGAIVLPIVRLARIGWIVEDQVRTWVVRLLASDALEKFSRLGMP